MMYLYILGGWLLASIPFALLIGRHLRRVSAMYPEADDATSD